MRPCYSWLLLAAATDGFGDGGGATRRRRQLRADDVEFLVHTGPGGGSDIFARDVVSMLREEELISANWPIRNEEAGEGAGAMAYLLGEAGEDNIISAMTTTWLTTPLTIEGVETQGHGSHTRGRAHHRARGDGGRAPTRPTRRSRDFVDAAKRTGRSRSGRRLDHRGRGAQRKDARDGGRHQLASSSPSRRSGSASRPC